jgi:hypothetical protein
VSSETDHPLMPVVKAWQEKIRQAAELKSKRFGKDAEEGMLFLAGPYDWLYDGKKGARHFFPPDGADLPTPTFKMTLNKAAELVQLFGPSLYHRNPVRQVNPRKFVSLPPDAFAQVAGGDPMAAQALFGQAQVATETGRALDEARAEVLSAYLNYTPDALDLKTESRWAIDEALVKGMGTLWTEVYRPAGAGHKLVGSFFDSVDNLQIDPDATSLRDAKWVARRCVHPVWEVERLYGLPAGTLRGNHESVNQTATADANPLGDYYRKTGQTNDLLVYWKVYSKMGAGGRLKGVADHVRGPLDAFGDFCKVVVCDTCNYPLNVPPWVIDAPDDGAAARQALEWETPFYADDAWPFTPIYFHSLPRDPWPLSHLAPGMGELKFLNWLWSFVASKIAITSRDFIACKKSLADEVKSTITGGKDLALIELEHEHGTITDVVNFLQHPNFNGDIWKVAEAVADQFDRRVGLTELMYGQSARQYRSAEEATVKQSAMNVRPDDMANKVEDAMGSLAKAEALAARWHLTPADVSPVLGPVGGWYWGQFLYTADPGEIVHGLEYRIEAGSAKKPNRERDADNMNQMMQLVFPALQQACMAVGNFEPLNNALRAWGKPQEIDVDRLGILFPQPPPPQAAPPAAAPPPGAAA